MTYFAFLLGFVLLYYGAEWLVAGAAAIATHYKAPKSLVGLTLVAFGTSAPEMVVNIFAADDPALALSNVSGSNLTNLCIGFGLSAMVGMIAVKRSRFGVDFLVLLLAPSIILGAFFLGPLDNPVVPYETMYFLLGFLAIYIFLLSRKREPEEEFVEDESNVDPNPKTNIIRHVLEFALGGVLLYLGGELVYRNAMTIAEMWSLPEQIIGLTLVACGTSIPDVTASVVAARRGEDEIAVGNLVGSNISNILVVLSATMIVSGRSLTGSSDILVDYSAVVFVSMAFAAYAIVRQRIDRFIGSVAIVLFILYYVFRIAWATGYLAI